MICHCYVDSQGALKSGNALNEIMIVGTKYQGFRHKLQRLHNTIVLRVDAKVIRLSHCLKISIDWYQLGPTYTVGRAA